MTAKVFVDTNVLVYATSNAAADQPRRDLALELLGRSDLALSSQVLAEFYSLASSTGRSGTMTPETRASTHASRKASRPACQTGFA